MSEFENKSLQELANLVAGAEPRALMARGDALLGLGEALGEIGTLIAGRLERVEWEGEAAAQFREWGRSFARESRALDEFTRHVGEAIRQAGQALSEAQSSMPKGTATGPVIDPAQGSAAGTGFHGSDFLDDVAAARAEEDRQEAIRVMERLSSHYRIAAQQMDRAEEPRFGAGIEVRPPQTGMTRPGGDEADRVVSEPPGTAPTVSSSPAGSGSGSLPDSQKAVSPPITEGIRPGLLDGSVGTSLDSVGPGGLPHTPGSSAAPGLAPAAGAGAQPGTPAQGPLPWGQLQAGSRTPAGPSRSIGTNPPPAGRSPRGSLVTPGDPLRPPSMKDRVTQGTQSPGVGRPAQTGGASRAGVTQKGPGGESPSVGRPGSGSATGGTPANGRPPAREGIVGGTRRPPDSSSSGSRLPKGAVIGPTPANQSGRPPQEATRRVLPHHGPVIGAPPALSERGRRRTTRSTSGIPGTGMPSLSSNKSRGELPKDRGGVIGLPRSQKNEKRPANEK